MGAELLIVAVGHLQAHHGGLHQRGGGAHGVEVVVLLDAVQSDVDFCVEMTEKVGVACVPGTSFFNEAGINNIVRVHFAKKDETLYEALNRLSDIKKKMA